MKPAAPSCALCGAGLEAPVYEQRGGSSITSLAQIVDLPTVVRVCDRCGHLQTDPIVDIAAYYDTAYKIGLERDDQDDLYALERGEPVFRSQHQLRTLLATLPMEPGARVLDYGSGKAATSQLLVEERPDLLVHVFDVSRDYQEVWSSFLPEHRSACYRPPSSWRGAFDVVMSFFVLEHVPAPQQLLHEMLELLAPGGMLYLVVPNPWGANASDVVVVDHVNHFSPRSMERLLASVGLELVSIDDRAHELAFVIVARAASATHAAPEGVSEQEVVAARSLGEYWSVVREALDLFERGHPGPAAIYGAGIVGAYIVSALREPERVLCFVDRNPHKQGATVAGKPVIGLSAFDAADVRAIYMALDPARGEAVAAEQGWSDGDPEVFFLPEREAMR